MSEQPLYLDDEPIEDEAKMQFGFDKLADRLATFIADKRTITPFAVAINGDWGSGKTSLLKVTRKKLERILKTPDSNTIAKHKIVWFNPWEYEVFSPSAALFQHIIDVFHPDRTTYRIESYLEGIGKFALDLLARQAVGMTSSEVIEHFKTSSAKISTVKDDLREIVSKSLSNGRLIVFVDDLDRCRIDNILGILESMKLFLTAQGCLFVIAADLSKIELAWVQRYGNVKEIAREGRLYLDKMLQLRIELPEKKRGVVETYILSLEPSLSKELRLLILDTVGFNPRKIKKLLNAMRFDRIDATKEPSFMQFIWYILVSNYSELTYKVRANPRIIIDLACEAAEVEPAARFYSILTREVSALREPIISNIIQDYKTDDKLYLLCKQVGRKYNLKAGIYYPNHMFVKPLEELKSVIEASHITG